MHNISINELKYCVPPTQRYRVLMQLRRRLETPLKYSRASVRTTYFDDDNLTSYYESRDGHLDKRKYRWREYVDVEKGGAPYSLEIKIRSAAATWKIKQHIYASLPKNYRPTTFLSLINHLGARLEFHLDDIPADLYPKVTLFYDRYRFNDPRDPDIRYNLDSNIRVYLSRLGETRGSAFIRCDKDILEVKAPSGKKTNLSFVDYAELGIKPITFSKYVWGMEAWESVTSPFGDFNL